MIGKEINKIFRKKSQNISETSKNLNEAPEIRPESFKSDVAVIAKDLKHMKDFLNDPSVIPNAKLSNILNNNQTYELDYFNSTNTQETKQYFLNLINNSLNIAEGLEENYHKEMIEIEDPLKNLKEKKQKHFDNSILFYNSLSLIMLAMLTGGLIGIIFILFFTFRTDDKL